MPGRYEREGDGTKEDFTGHVKDEATGLHYAGARYYSAAFGRWTTTDPILGQKGPKALLKQDVRLLSMTSYNYAFSNPVRLNDPTGLAPYDDYVIEKDGSATVYRNDKRNRYFVNTDDGLEKIDLSTEQGKKRLAKLTSKNSKLRNDIWNTATENRTEIGVPTAEDIGGILVRGGTKQAYDDPRTQAVEDLILGGKGMTAAFKAGKSLMRALKGSKYMRKARISKYLEPSVYIRRKKETLKKAKDYVLRKIEGMFSPKRGSTLFK